MADSGLPTTPLAIPEAAAVPSTPSPSTSFASSPLRSQMNRPQLPRRQSRFTEDMTGEHTPAPSVYDTASPIEREPAPSMVSARSRGAGNGRAPSTYTYTPSHAPSREYRPLELIMRGMNSCIHGAVCVILFAVMVEFLAQSRSSWLGRISAQAVALLVFLGIDTLLDIISLIRLQKQWASWASLLRLVCGIAYIILFITYVSNGPVFPRGYTFWAMSPKFSGPVVYIFLWLLVLWDLSHVALHRQPFGNGMHSCFGPSSSSTPRHHPIPPRRSSSTRWRRWIGASDRYSRSRDHDIEVNPHFPRPGLNMNNMSATTVVPSPPTSLRDPNSFAEPKRPSFTASFTATTSTMSSQSLPKVEEKPCTSSTSKEDGHRGQGKSEEVV